MMTTFSRSQTLASSRRNAALKMPMVPGPQTSWVMRTSTSTQMFSPGATCVPAGVAGQDFFGHGHRRHEVLLLAGVDGSSIINPKPFSDASEKR